jgi:hypothetical protein
MGFKFVRAWYLRPKMTILRQVTDYSFAESDIKQIEISGTDVFIYLEGLDGYSIKAQDDHIFMVKE